MRFCGKAFAIPSSLERCCGRENGSITERCATWGCAICPCATLESALFTPSASTCILAGSIGTVASSASLPPDASSHVLTRSLGAPTSSAPHLSSMLSNKSSAVLTSAASPLFPEHVEGSLEKCRIGGGRLSHVKVPLEGVEPFFRR